jgi:hypothetical protein
MNDTKPAESLDQLLATRKSGSEGLAVNGFEAELLPVASEEFMTTVEDLPVQERACLGGKR